MRTADFRSMTRCEFIEANMGLVGSIAKKYAKRTVDNPMADRDDLVNVGAIGLMLAYDRFDESLGYKFSTYATHYIEGEIRKFITRDCDPIKFGRRPKLDFYQIHKYGMLDSSVDEISEKLGMSVDHVIDALEYYEFRTVKSFDKERKVCSSDNLTMENIIGECHDYTEDMRIEEFLGGLGNRTRKIVEMRLEDKTQKEIGVELGLSQITISRELKKLQERIMRAGKGAMSIA